MRLGSRAFTFLVAVDSLVVSSPRFVAAAAAKPKYLCDTDADCEARFPDTICIAVDVDGDVPGLCPSYQSPELGYLNAHCVFVAKDVKQSTNQKQTRGLATVTKKPSSSDGSTDDVVVSDGASEPEDDVKSGGSATVSEEVVTVMIGNDSVVGEFVCVDLSDCAIKAYDPTTCEPLACGAPGAKTQCNAHGTCSYASTQAMDKRSCQCYAGYGGAMCQHEVSNACDVDCGLGGDCVDGACQCKPGFDGKAFKGKKGKPNQRCTKCTNDQTCQNGDQCVVETGACACDRGFSGPTCGATEDACTTMRCGGGGECMLLANKTAACFCAGSCVGSDCVQCATKDSATCQRSSAAASLNVHAVAVMLVMAVVHVLMFTEY